MAPSGTAPIQSPPCLLPQLVWIGRATRDALLDLLRWFIRASCEVPPTVYHGRVGWTGALNWPRPVPHAPVVSDSRCPDRGRIPARFAPGRHTYSLIYIYIYIYILSGPDKLRGSFFFRENSSSTSFRPPVFYQFSPWRGLQFSTSFSV